MSGPTVADCAAIWNGERNAGLRVAAAAMRPREVSVAVVQAAGGILDGPPPPRCMVFFRDPGDDGAAPSVLGMGRPAMGRGSTWPARGHITAPTTRRSGPPNAVLGEDGTISLKGG